MTRAVILGEVAGVFGIRGWVKVRSDTRPREGIFDYPVWQIAGREYAQLEGIEDRDAARALVGCTIAVDRSALPPAGPGEYYWVDLIGSTVVNEAGEALGTVTDMMETGVHDVMVLKQGGRDRLIPFVQGPIVQSVDCEAGRIVVSWEADE